MSKGRENDAATGRVLDLRTEMLRRQVGAEAERRVEQLLAGQRSGDDGPADLADAAGFGLGRIYGPFRR